MTTETMAHGIIKIILVGDLDAKGAAEIDEQFQASVAANQKVLVDLGQVGFLASIGIRSLIMAAKVNGRNGGKLVLMDPNDFVAMVLEGSGADSVLSIVKGIDSALLEFS